jgi:hypothetical protein
VRVSNQTVGPCESESDFNGHNFFTVSGHILSKEDFEETVVIAERLWTMQHPIVFTHGRLKHHNTMFSMGISLDF